MAYSRVTRKDVARAAGVSETTVSVVMNDNKNIVIADETRKKVLNAAEKLGYYPNHAAKTMAGKRCYTIGVVSPWDAEVWYFAQMLDGIRCTASQWGYGVILCNVLEKDGDVEDCVRFFHEGRIDGVVYLPPNMAELPGVDRLRSEKVPTVLCNGISPYDEIDSIVIDYANGIEKAARYLTGLGFERLLYILPDEVENLCAGDADRLTGFERVAVCDGVKSSEKEVFSLRLNLEERLNKAEEILGSRKKPLGVITCYYYQAYYMQLAAIKAGLSLDKDIRVIAGDHPDFTNNIYPKVTGIELPFYQLGLQSSKILIDRIEQRGISKIQIKIDSNDIF